MQATILPYMVLTAGICLLAVSIYLFGSKKRPVLGKSRALLLVPLLGIVCALSPLIAEAKTVHPKATGDSTTYYVCGDEAQLDVNEWTSVQNGQFVNDPYGYYGALSSYTGMRGDGSTSMPNCTGLYHWSWNGGPSRTVTWTWLNANLYGYSNCSAAVHIPSWYAGAPDASYTFTISSQNAGTSGTEIVDQNQPSTTWLDLKQIGSILLPTSIAGVPIYNLSLTLTSGNQGGWYLGADAVAFTCSASSVNWF